MKRTTSLKMIVSLLLSAASLVQAGESVAIKGRDGKTIQAEILSADEDSVKIRRGDGKEFDLPYSRVSDESVESIRKLLAEREANKPVERAKVPKDPKTPEDIPEKVVVKKGDVAMATFTVVDDGLARPVIVKEEPAEVPFFSVDFSHKGESAMATVKATFEKPVLLRCLARNKGEKRYYPTSILTLHKGLPSFESWADEVEELVFFDFRFEEKPAE